MGKILELTNIFCNNEIMCDTKQDVLYLIELLKKSNIYPENYSNSYDRFISNISLMVPSFKIVIKIYHSKLIYYRVLGNIKNEPKWYNSIHINEIKKIFRYYKLKKILE